MQKRKSFQFRLKPTKKQRKILDGQLEECRWLYNELLAGRKKSYEKSGFSLAKYQQQAFLPFLKEERPSLLCVHSQVLQNVNDRIDKAFQGFFRRIKAGEKPGYPRFRGEHRYNSFCYTQSGFSLADGNLRLSKIGVIRIKQHRPISGVVKTCTLRKNASGEWDVSFSCVVDTFPLPENDKSVGIDVGIESFATLTEGPSIPNPKFFRQAEKHLGKAQRKLIRAGQGNTRTPEGRKSLRENTSENSESKKRFLPQGI